MATDTQSKILSIEEKIKKLKEQQKREVAKLERNTGKKFLEKFNLENKSIEQIQSVIDLLFDAVDNIDLEKGLVTTKDNIKNETEENDQSHQ